MLTLTTLMYTVSTLFNDSELNTMKNPTKIQPRNLLSNILPLEFFPPDKLQTIVQVVDGLATEEAALSRLDELLIEEVENDFEIGAVLSKMKDKGWFSGYMSFEEFCKARYGFRKSKGYQHLAIYRALNKLQIPWEDVKEIGSAKC